MEYKRHPKRLLKHIASIPFIYAGVIGIVTLDIFMELYHRVCFPLYGLKYIERGKYIKIMDRFALPYLSPVEKINCAYCGYVNGVLFYSFVIAQKTEEYWCAIRHKQNKGFVEPAHEKSFVDYGDKEEYQKRF